MMRIKDLYKEKEQGAVQLYGWVSSLRTMKKKTFIDLRDETGMVQIVAIGTVTCSLESFVSVRGCIQKRNKGDCNISPYFVYVQSLEIQCTDFEIVNASSHVGFMPYKFKDKTDVLKDRYMYLRTTRMQHHLRLYSEMKHTIRRYLDDEGWIDIATPYISSPSDEGSRQVYASTGFSRAKGFQYALSQSPQLYKQILMASGFEKYYQIARCFRDEDLRTDRQMEFEQLDVETARHSVKDVQALLRTIVALVFRQFNKTISFSELSFNDAIFLYGSDKPDLRITDTIQSLDGKMRVEVNSYRDGQSISDMIAQSKLNDLMDCTVDNLGSRTVITWPNKCNTYVSLTTIGRIIRKFGNRQQVDDFKAVWIKDWPLLIQQREGVVPSQHPFFAVRDSDVSIGGYVEAIDLVINGQEVASGGQREMRPDIIRSYFNLIGSNADKYNDFFKVLEAGTPPHGGFGLGLERLACLLLDLQSIREVIAFPKSRTGLCSLFGPDVPG